MYLGLKIGWGFGASLFGAIFSFAFLKPMSRILPPWLGGGYFGAKENCTAQAAATTAGGLSVGFVSGIPAMYKLGLMTTPTKDAAALFLFSLSAAFYGLFFAVPLRKHFVVKQDLTFPTPRAAANTIIALHESVDGEKEAMKKAKWMGIWFGSAFIWNLIAYWAPFFADVHVLYYIGHRANYEPLMSADRDWLWYFSFDFPFFGAGLMTPGSTVLTFFITTILVYGIIGPCLVANGTFAQPLGFIPTGDTTNKFFLWPGIALMVFASFTELLVHYKVLWRGIKGGILEIGKFIRKGYYYARLVLMRKQLSKEESDDIFEKDLDDKYQKHELVPDWWWISGTFVSIVFTCAIMGRYFGMPVYQSIVAVILGFILSFIGIQAAGETDINPVGSIGKMTQLVFAKMPADNLKHLQSNNLMAGNIGASAAAQAVDMVGDLKTGQLVGASPRSQFLAQVVASFPAVGIAVGLFILFSTAYPCIINPDLDAECQFQLVAVKAWYEVTKILTGDGAPLSRPCVIFTIVCAVLGVAGPVTRHFLLPKKYHRYFPSISAAGIAMINYQAEVPIAMFVGWAAGQIWKRYWPRQHGDFMYSVAGGLIAGQGISSLLRAVFTICNIPANVITASCIGGQC
ncbi:hypothetical protein EC973_001211 [Apophysomyces ossiformis]|uniref:Oligopeptide transporter n=1 Tax=Apophysomyces ossiformis TaxID=679940 RepID=A0A8H7EMJ6_9FUNG|nr:hypothetical protein EC973_001211 [Apophysomyces ossiformis]